MRHWKSLLLAGLVAAAMHRVAAQSGSSVDTSGHPRILISLAARTLTVVDSGGDTVRVARAAVGSGRTLSSVFRWWRFRTPKGAATVSAKEVNPVWIPPDWHYVEIANSHRLEVARLEYGKPIVLADGRVLTIVNDEVGVIVPGASFAPLPHREEIVFNGTLYIPPFGSANRKIEGELGGFRLLLTNGVGIHGTPYKDSIGKAVTHGCIRLSDEDIKWLYDNVPVGTRVIIY